MVKSFATIVFTLCLFTYLEACSAGEEPYGKPAGIPDEEESDRPGMNRKITLRIGRTTCTASLHDNASARAFHSLLPLSGTMNDHAGNEKYLTLPVSLPTETFAPGTIRAGDLMLWGDDCLVLFYETFSSPYGYTRIGRIDDPEELAAAAGHGDVTVMFQPEK